jgi:hypothetical protein
VLAHVVVKLVSADRATVVDVEVLEELHWLEGVMPTKVLPAGFNLIV